MENHLADHIRDHRKRLGLTQEQLAERLGITLGTVSKWERGSSEPDLGYIMDLAELFHISVDALIGFSMRVSDADEEADRIEAMFSKAPQAELKAACESALKRFPNHFRIAMLSASACKRFGVMRQNKADLRMALDLYRHAIGLISQNRDPEINEVLLRNQIAECYCELEDYKKAVEEYRKNNLSGSNNAIIGLITILNDKKPEEGVKYTPLAFFNQISEFTTIMYGFIHYSMETGNAVMGVRAAEWSIEHLTKAIKDPARHCFLDKIISVFVLLRAAILDRDGQTERSEEDLRRAVRMARAFDGDPVYTTENLIFIERGQTTGYAYDDMGPTAIDALRNVLTESGDTVTASFREKLEKEIG